MLPFAEAQVTLSKQEHVALVWAANYWQAQQGRTARRLHELEARYEQRLRVVTQQAAEREAALVCQIETLRGKVRDLKRRLFGRKSERRKGGSERQGRGEAARVPRGQQRGTSGHGRRREAQLAEEVEVVGLDSPCCPDCGLELRPFPGAEDSEVLEIEVRAYRRKICRRRYRAHYNCGCLPGIVTAPPSPRLIARGKRATCDLRHRAEHEALQPAIRSPLPAMSKFTKAWQDVTPIMRVRPRFRLEILAKPTARTRASQTSTWARPVSPLVCLGSAALMVEDDSRHPTLVVPDKGGPVALGNMHAERSNALLQVNGRRCSCSRAQPTGSRHATPLCWFRHRVATIIFLPPSPARGVRSQPCPMVTPLPPSHCSPLEGACGSARRAPPLMPRAVDRSGKRSIARKGRLCTRDASRSHASRDTAECGVLCITTPFGLFSGLDSLASDFPWGIAAPSALNANDRTRHRATRKAACCRTEPNVGTYALLEGGRVIARMRRAAGRVPERHADEHSRDRRAIGAKPDQRLLLQCGILSAVDLPATLEADTRFGKRIVEAAAAEASPMQSSFAKRLRAAAVGPWCGVTAPIAAPVVAAN